MGTRAAFATNNPLNTTLATTSDAMSPGIKTEECVEGGKNLASVHNGDFAGYKAFDFDSGVAAFKVRLASIRAGSIEVHLDKADGPLMGTIPFKPTGGWQAWQDATCTVDNSQSGVRDVYLVFHGAPGPAIANVSRFVFLKSVVIAKQGLDLSGRLDAEDSEPQAKHAWGMPENGFSDSFEDGSMKSWIGAGLTVGNRGIDGRRSLASAGQDPAFAYTPNVYINKTDTGGEWRSIAEASLAADIVIDAKSARPGIGFASKDGKQRIFVSLNAEDDSLEVWRKLADGSLVRIAVEPKAAANGAPAVSPARAWHLQLGVKYRLQIDWSPYSNGLIAFLHDDNGGTLTSFRTVIDLPAARRPLLVCSGGPARFDDVKFDPTLDIWNYKWEWKKEPVLAGDVCNPAVWKGKDGKLYMMWRKFGADTFHGIASSTDGIHWTRVIDEVIKATGDMNVVVDPFGDGKLYVTPGGGGMPWWTSDGSDEYKIWTKTALTTGNIFGNSRIQEIIDTKRYPQMHPVAVGGKEYRFVAFTEDWNRMPKPHTVVLLSNTLTDWVKGSPDPVLPPMDSFWGEKGSAIGAAIPLPDGNILLASCSCTNAGYTGAPEPSNVSVIVDGRQPWKILKLGTLPDAPVSREGVWYQGPNFGTAYYYDDKSDTLYFYGGFHDHEIGMMRVRNFRHENSMADRWVTPANLSQTRNEDATTAVASSALLPEQTAGAAALPDWALGPFTRPENAQPIITPNPKSTFDDPMRKKSVHWEATHTFNPAAVVKDGVVYVLYRAEDDNGAGIGGYTSRLGLAVSADGLHFQRMPMPVLFPAEDDQKGREWEGGCEDPRCVELEDGSYALFYTQYHRLKGEPTHVDLGLALSRDLIHWTKLGPVTGIDADGKSVTPSKSASLVCAPKGGRLIAAKINGRYWLYYGEGTIRLMSSPDLRSWRPEPGVALPPRRGHFDSDLAECGPPAILTRNGIVLLYNGKNSTDPAAADPNLKGGVYSNGQALFDARDPTKLLARTDQPFFKPELPWEATGQYAAGTTFIEGLVAFKGKWMLYYGCADSNVGVATADMKPEAPVASVTPPLFSDSKPLDFHGFDGHELTIDGCSARVVEPKQPLPGNPWVWRTMFWDAFPAADIALLNRGYYVAFIDVGNTFGCPDAMIHFDAFYREMTQQYGLSKKPALEGLSRGGLYAYRWAYDHTDKVGCIYGDAPVCDMKSWPGGKGKGIGSPGDWQEAIRDYHFKDEAEMLKFTGNPIDILTPIADAHIPIIHVCGDSDSAVPKVENTDIVRDRYTSLGGDIVVIVKQGCDHHPHGLADSRPVVDFIVAHTAGGAASEAASNTAPTAGSLIVLPKGKW